MSKQIERSTENAGFLNGRGYTAAFLYEFFSLIVGNGVYLNELAPIATDEDMSVTIGPGHAWINGILYKNERPIKITLATADGSLNRCDGVHIRLNLSLNEAYAIGITGAYATNPTETEVVRNAETYDLKICDVDIPAGCTKITQGQIKDRRLDSSVCGVPVFPVEHLDMTSFYRQIATDLANFQQKNEADFTAWVEDQKDTNLADMAALVEVVRNTSDDSKAEILNLLAQLNNLVDADTVGKLIAQINSKLSTSGDTMTGPLNVPDPTEQTHAANKGYVDTKVVPITLLASGWAGTAAPYTQTVEVTGLTDDHRAEAHPAYTGILETDLAIKEACAALSYAKMEGNSITFTCLEERPGTDIPVEVEVYR